MPVIEIETTVRAPIDRIFDLSRSIDLHVASTAQTGERAVAGKLSREWAGARVRVVAIPEYYRAATTGFRELLRAKGYRADELGEHADLADTSLTLALEPRLVRTSGIEAPPSGPSGADGDARRASAELGRLGIELIVSRTVAAIKESLK